MYHTFLIILIFKRLFTKGWLVLHGHMSNKNKESHKTKLFTSLCEEKVTTGFLLDIR